MQQPVETDILILGAGPGGTAAALFLAKEGIPCTMVDKAVFPRDKVCGDALSGKVVEVLRKYDPEFVGRLAQNESHLGSWGVVFVAPNKKSLRVPFKQSYDKEKQVAPGFIARRFDFDHEMLLECKRFDGINIVEDCALTDFKRENGRWEMSSEDGKHRFSAKVVIVADGAHSRFARSVHGMTMDPMHHCAGIRAYYKGVTGLDSDNFIELHFLKDFLPGYFWIFPLPNGYANVGVGMRTDKVSAKKVNLKQEMLRILKDHPDLKDRFEHAELDGPVMGYGLPLGSKKRPISGDGYMLIGDAASLIDPFTGEGIGNAVYSGFFAAQHAAQCLEKEKFGADFMKSYDAAVYGRLWDELSLSFKMQKLVNYPWLFNLVVNKARKNKTLSDTISCMFEDMYLRDRLRNPSFYFKLLFDNGH